MSWSAVSETGTGQLVTHPLTPDRFGDLELVMGERGVARSCFCMHWRRPDGGYDDKRDNRDRFADIANSGPPPGLIGYLDGEPAGWVQVGPRDDFPTISRSRLLKPVDDAETWSINCFVVRVGYRRRGIGTGLLDAAIEYAKTKGARLIEAYPVDGERASVVDYFTGTLGMFDRHGFVEIIRRNDTRPIVRLEVS
jgi:GNAT superfamily N-acetyltransferase